MLPTSKKIVGFAWMIWLGSTFQSPFSQKTASMIGVWMRPSAAKVQATVASERRYETSAAKKNRKMNIRIPARTRSITTGTKKGAMRPQVRMKRAWVLMICSTCSAGIC